MQPRRDSLSALGARKRVLPASDLAGRHRRRCERPSASPELRGKRAAWRGGCRSEERAAVWACKARAAQAGRALGRSSPYLRDSGRQRCQRARGEACARLVESSEAANCKDHLAGSQARAAARSARLRAAARREPPAGAASRGRGGSAGARGAQRPRRRLPTIPSRTSWSRTPPGRWQPWCGGPRWPWTRWPATERRQLRARSAYAAAARKLPKRAPRRGAMPRDAHLRHAHVGHNLNALEGRGHHGDRTG